MNPQNLTTQNEGNTSFEDETDPNWSPKRKKERNDNYKKGDENWMSKHRALKPLYASKYGWVKRV